MLIVQKYGGTSVGSIERMRNVAARCLATAKQGHQVAVVVSATEMQFAPSLTLKSFVSIELSPLPSTVISEALFGGCKPAFEPCTS